MKGSHPMPFLNDRFNSQARVTAADKLLVTMQTVILD